MTTNGQSADIAALTNGYLIRLQRLTGLIQREVEHLADTDARLFALPLPEVKQALAANDPLVTERVDAFVARFGRLQDNLADKLLPALLTYLAEPTRAVLENLAFAEKLGWIASVNDWLLARKLRNQLIHDYEDDATSLVDALYEAHLLVPMLVQMANKLQNKVAELH
jgi:hypothetical protein